MVSEISVVLEGLNLWLGSSVPCVVAPPWEGAVESGTYGLKCGLSKKRSAEGHSLASQHDELSSTVTLFLILQSSLRWISGILSTPGTLLDQYQVLKRMFMSIRNIYPQVSFVSGFRNVRRV